MKARADALAAEQAQRAQANKIYQAEAAAKRAAGADALAAEQAQRAQANLAYQAQAAVQREQAAQALAAEQAQRAAEPPVVTASYYGQNLQQTPLAQRQQDINLAQGRPTQYLGGALQGPSPMPRPQGPVRPQTMPRSQPGQLPQARVNPGMRPPQPQGSVRPPQMNTFMPQQPQARPEPTFMQQYGGIIQPLATAGIGALFKNLF